MNRRFLWSISAVAAALCACSTPARPPTVHDAPARVPLMGYPTLTGLEQVRDPRTGDTFFTACNPCAGPTTKTMHDAPAQPSSVRADASPVSRPGALALPAESNRLTLLFASASARLDKKARRELEPLLRAAAHGGRIVIRGGADASGRKSKNRVLAKRRAQAVYAAFLAAGVPAERLTISACATCYVASNTSPDGRRANRRAEIELIR